MKKNLLKVVLFALVCAIMCMPAFADGETVNPDDIPDDAVMYKLDMDSYSYFADFEEGLYESENYTNSVEDLGISNNITYSAAITKARLAHGEDAISGDVSLEIDGGMDMRVWSMSLIEGAGDYVFVEFLVKIIDFTNGNFTISLTDPDLEKTFNEGTGGIIGGIGVSKGVPTFKNRSRVQAELEMNRVYKLAFGIHYGENLYDMYVDGVLVSEGNKWVGEFNNLSAMRYDCGKCHIIIDDVIITFGEKVTKAEYFATPAPTPEPTATPAPTDVPTAVPEATEAPTAAPAEKKGCNSVMFSSTAVFAVTVLAAAIVIRKKEK